MTQGGDTDGGEAQPKGDERKATFPIRVRVRSRYYAAAAKEKYQVARKYVGKAPKAISWLSGRAWRGGGVVVKWFDSHNGLLTAAATVAIAVLTYYVVTITANQGQTTSRQLAVMQSQQRPWLRGRFNLTSLSIMPNGINYMVGSTLTNTGNYPAEFAIAVGILFLGSNDDVAEQKQVCDTVRSSWRNTARINNNSIFPGDSVPQPDASGLIRTDQINAWQDAVIKRWGKTRETLTTAEQSGIQQNGFQLIGCIEYGNNNLDDPRVYETGFILSLDWKSMGPGFSGASFITDLTKQGAINISRLEFIPANYGNYAK